MQRRAGSSCRPGPRPHPSHAKQAKAVNAGHWRVQDYILGRPNSLFNRRSTKRAVFDHVRIASGVGFSLSYGLPRAFAGYPTAEGPDATGRARVS
jgi:hypothetical protein